MYVEKRLSFDPTRDRDIIEYLDGMTAYKANQLIRDLVRDHMRDVNESRLSRIERKLDAINSKLSQPMSFSASVPPEESDVSDIVLLNIDNLGV